jgi:hypothetical protein
MGLRHTTNAFNAEKQQYLIYKWRPSERNLSIFYGKLIFTIN